MIFTSTISVQAGYCQCQTNSRAPREFVSDFLIKIFYLNNLKSLPISIQISNCNFRIIGYCYLIDCCSNIIYYFDIKFKTCFADILMFIFAKSQ